MERRINGMVDYHLHTARCGHARGSMREYVKRAVQLGFSEIGFADHLPLLNRRDSSLTMDESELPGYLQEIESIREDFPGIEIKAGIEADFFPDLVRETADVLKRYPFDYVIGSVHFLDGWGFDDPRGQAGYAGRRPPEVYEEYFNALIASAESRLFDIIAHPDLIKKYDYRPGVDVSLLYAEAARAIAESGAAVEINTAGLRKPVGEIYPTLDFLELCQEKGAPLTFGSDAHAPEEVGRDFNAAAVLAREAGYRRVATFAGRQMTLADIPLGGMTGGR
ncbi:MAG: histidinol-phosphatase HisJ family protein [Actinobacteria bacterium]|nr:histidinol-phosphatase HisJ family protein [Actinomycetota bacterium]